MKWAGDAYSTLTASRSLTSRIPARARSSRGGGRARYTARGRHRHPQAPAGRRDGVRDHRTARELRALPRGAAPRRRSQAGCQGFTPAQKVGKPFCHERASRQRIEVDDRAHATKIRHRSRREHTSPRQFFNSREPRIPSSWSGAQMCVSSSRFIRLPERVPFLGVDHRRDEITSDRRSTLHRTDPPPVQSHSFPGWED